MIKWRQPRDRKALFLVRAPEVELIALCRHRGAVPIRKCALVEAASSIRPPECEELHVCSCRGARDVDAQRMWKKSNNCGAHVTTARHVVSENDRY